ncbi:MAG: bifunctional lysylphosphatidylglycerol flippase/synthetase MprF [Gaiellaceae bacterium]
MARKALAFPLVVLVATAATGWMYVLHPSLPGPRLGEALPLDELSRHAAVAIAWYAAVWAVGAVLLGLYARWAGIERLTAALALGLAVGSWSYFQLSVSIAIVRQVSLRSALDTAVHVHASYVAAAAVAIASAILARPKTGVARAPFLVAAVVALAGALNLLHAILPGRDSGILHSMTPDAVGPLAHAAGALAAIAMLVAARGLARRRHRAWQVAVAVTSLSTVLHVLYGLNHGTLASTVVLVLLLARRHDFDRPGDTSTRRVVAARLLTALAAIALYALSALWLNRMAADQSFSVGFAVRETLDGLTGQHLLGSPHFAGGFSDWFPLSLLLLGAASVLWVLSSWIAPWRHRVDQQERERALAHELVHTWGADTLAPFVLRADKAYFFSEDETAFLAYRVVSGVAIVSGDPIGPRDRLGDLIDRFVAYAHRRDWRIAILGASETCLPLYRARGLHALYHGDEAIVDTGAFSLDGRAIRKVRQSVHRLAAAGYSVLVARPSEVAASLRSELEDVAKEWRGNAPERGFVMALDALFALGDDDAVFVIGFDGDGNAAGFLHFAVSSSALSLSSMPRRRTTPNGFNEWLICEAIAWARANGFRRVSLNFAPFAALLAPEADLSSIQELQRRALLSLKGHFQLDNLLAFNRKFFPDWERRFVVYERHRDLPRVGIAALAAEAYLPFQNGRK